MYFVLLGEEIISKINYTIFGWHGKLNLSLGAQVNLQQFAGLSKLIIDDLKTKLKKNSLKYKIAFRVLIRTTTKIY